MDYMGFYDKRGSNCLLYIDIVEVEKFLIVLIDNV